MGETQQNTLYLLAPGSYVSRDHLTLQVEVPVYSPDLPPERRSRETATENARKWPVKPIGSYDKLWAWIGTYDDFLGYMAGVLELLRSGQKGFEPL
jgi:hypothetical protein